MSIKVVFPDKKEIIFDAEISPADAIGQWRKEALSHTVAAKINGIPVDLHSMICKDAQLELIDISSDEGLSILRHSISHVMAQAVQEIFPGAKVSIGPSIAEGFYYDFEYPESFTVDDFPKIEKKMREIIRADYPFIREELPRVDAMNLFRQRGEEYKVQLINDLPDDIRIVSIYKQGGYIDLCRGPHIPSTGMIKAFRLLSVAGAYWRGDEKTKCYNASMVLVLPQRTI